MRRPLDPPRHAETTGRDGTPIRNHHGDVYATFLGSGTTLIAADKLGRRCLGMELDPRYVHHWVEPDPVPFARLQAMADLERQGLSSRGLLPRKLDRLLADCLLVLRVPAAGQRPPDRRGLANMLRSGEVPARPKWVAPALR
jgi:hypothetical protein